MTHKGSRINTRHNKESKRISILISSLLNKTASLRFRPLRSHQLFSFVVDAVLFNKLEINMETHDGIKQQVLDATHKRTMEHLQLYASGLITFTELASSIEMLAEEIKILVGSKDGLLCPNTGLRFHKDFR